jgi:hypothetical protein
VTAARFDAPSIRQAERGSLRAPVRRQPGDGMRWRDGDGGIIADEFVAVLES